jgi:hypothetical protein
MRSKLEKSWDFLKNSLYIWETSWYDKQAGRGQKLFLCPLLGEGRNPTGIPLTLTWLLGNILKGGKHNDSEG